MIQNTLSINFSIQFNSIPSRQPNHSQNMDSRLSGGVTGIPMKSTRGLLLSKPYEPNYPLSTTKTNVVKRKGSFAVSIKNHGNCPSMTTIAKRLYFSPSI